MQTQIAAARAEGIPVTTITETLTPPTASWEQWQTAQLVRLRAALGAGHGPMTGVLAFEAAAVELGGRRLWGDVDLELARG